MTLRVLLAGFLAALLALSPAAPALAQQQTVNLGSAPNDGTGDGLRVAFDKLNDNDTELYQSGHPGYVPDQWYGPRAGGRTSTPVVADKLRALPIRIGKTVTVKALGFRLSTAAAGNVMLCMYGTTNGRPGSLVAEISSAQSTGGSPGDISGTITSPPTLAPGWYWPASNFSATPNAIVTGGGDGLFGELIGGFSVSSVANTSSQVGGVESTHVYNGTCPATFGTPTTLTTGVPVVVFQAQ